MGAYIKLFVDSLDTMSALDDADAGRLFRAILQYRRDRVVPEMTGNERYVFPEFKKQLDRQMAKYDLTCEKNRLNRNGTGGDKNQPVVTSGDDSSRAVTKNGDGLRRRITDKNTLLSDVPSDAKDVNTFSPDGKPYRAAVWLDAQVKAHFPSFKPRSERELQLWADAFDKTARLDGRAWDDIDAVLQYSQKDKFWAANIRSGPTFRKQYENLAAKLAGGTHGG